MTDKSVLRKEQILSSARKLFEKNGYCGVTMDSIAKKSGIAKGTLYIYFDSKVNLFVETFMKIFDEIITDVKDIINLELDFESTISSILDYCNTTLKRDEYVKMFSLAHRGGCHMLPDDVTGEMKKKIIPYFNLIKSELNNYLKSQIKNDPVRIDDISNIILALSLIIASSNSQTLKKTILHILMNGIKKEGIS